jgi:hypothetical protein
VELEQAKLEIYSLTREQLNALESVLDYLYDNADSVLHNLEIDSDKRGIYAGKCNGIEECKEEIHAIYREGREQAQKRTE